MNDGISSMNLSEALVARVVEEHLNSQMLKQPHRVKGLNFCDGFVWVELERVEAAPVQPVAALSNKAVQQVLRPEPAPDNGKRKMLSDAQRQVIYDAVFADPKRPASSIAAEVGVSVTTVAGYVTQYRKVLAEIRAGNGNGNNRMEAVHSAEPVQEQFRGNGSGA